MSATGDDAAGDARRPAAELCCRHQAHAKGYQESWIGYKRISTRPTVGFRSGILTSASVNDSQVAIPLATMTAERVKLYDLMDAARRDQSAQRVTRTCADHRCQSAQQQCHIQAGTEAGGESEAHGQPYAKDVRYRERSTVERVNGRLKDEFGARQVRVRGHSKVLCHLMFGVLALTVDQLLRLVN